MFNTLTLTDGGDWKALICVGSHNRTATLIPASDGLYVVHLFIASRAVNDGHWALPDTRLDEAHALRHVESFMNLDEDELTNVERHENKTSMDALFRNLQPLYQPAVTEEAFSYGPGATGFRWRRGKREAWLLPATQFGLFNMFLFINEHEVVAQDWQYVGAIFPLPAKSRIDRFLQDRTAGILCAARKTDMENLRAVPRLPASAAVGAAVRFHGIEFYSTPDEFTLVASHGSRLVTVWKSRSSPQLYGITGYINGHKVNDETFPLPAFAFAPTRRLALLAATDFLTASVTYTTDTSKCWWLPQLPEQEKTDE